MMFAALIAARTAAASSRLLRRGSGTTYPGVLAERIHPDLIRDLSRRLRSAPIVVTGTNGKTTTSKMLGDTLAAAGMDLLRNESGSNLRQGIASALAAGTGTFSGRVRAETAVLEVDEATTASVVPLVQPRVFCITNLSRDQLDRYGDLETIGSRLAGAVASAPEATLLLNADDPLVVALAKHHQGPVAYFGLDTTGLADAASTRGMNAAPCPECGEPTQLSAVAYGHLGAWRCASCGVRRPEPEFAVSDVRLTAHSSTFTLTTLGQSARVTLPIAGLHNVYNALAAASCAAMLGLPLRTIADSLADFEPAFGRSEALVVEGHDVQLLLAKNPVGSEQTITSVLADATPKALGFALNDNLADGTDVSWIWDVDFEAHDLSGIPIVVSGNRARDLALRFKYAGKHGVRVCEDPVDAIRLLAELTPADGSAHMLATYTAMLAIRNVLVPSRGRFSTLGKGLRHGLQH
jgi:UDP-N-acetylmuramyl tripeptide synthase